MIARTTSRSAMRFAAWLKLYPEEVLALIAKHDSSDELLQAMRKWLSSVDGEGRRLWLVTSE